MSGAGELGARWLAHVVDRVAVNDVVRDGDRWIKRRRLTAPALIVPGNVYLRRAARFTMLADPEAWAIHEVLCHTALHGEESAGRAGARAIWTSHLPGMPLTRLVAEEERDEARVLAAMQAAGVEIRRAHETMVEGEAFSHGDLHLSNLLFDGGRARILDFETAHDPALDARERHADDLVAVALDLVGKLVEGGEGRGDELAGSAWDALVDGYRGAAARERASAVVETLARALAELVVADGLLSRSIQIVRTRHTPPATLARALARFATTLSG